MARKKKISFKLDPEWLVKEPVDFELKKYTLLDYLQKCEQRFDKLEIYPDFVELSLHLANVQSLVKENVLLLTDKKFESCDDEILLKELYPKKPRTLSSDEEQELDKTIRFSGGKLFDAFNIAKSIWNIAFDNIEVNVRRNKEYITLGKNFSYYYERDTETLYVWEFEMKKMKNDANNYKGVMKLIYESKTEDLPLSKILETFSKWNQLKSFNQIPIFEIKSNQKFPIDSTLIPLVRRKLLTCIFQTMNSNKLKNFDS